MAIAPLTNTEFGIVPLEAADAAALEDLLDAQCAEWMDLLKWDYSGPSQMIRQVIRDRELSGFAATSGRRTIGFVYYVVEGNRCSIGDIYVSKPWRGSGADRQMTAAVLEALDKTPRVRRIESQCVGVNNEGSNRLLEGRGFNRFSRLFMLRAIRGEDRSGCSPEPSQVVIREWRAHDFDAAARIIHRSYQGQPDSLINSQYRSEAGCAELLTILTDHIWCGEFLPDVSLLATGKTRSGTPNKVGVLIASRIAEGAGHIGQISVLPLHQGTGIGRRLIARALSEFAKLGFKTVSLAVTSENANALRLYESCGFHTIHEFPVFYRGR